MGRYRKTGAAPWRVAVVCAVSGLLVSWGTPVRAQDFAGRSEQAVVETEFAADEQEVGTINFSTEGTYKSEGKNSRIEVWLDFSAGSSEVDTGLHCNEEMVGLLDQIFGLVAKDEGFGLRYVTVIGYTQPGASLEESYALSERRAKAVRSWLKDRYPILGDEYIVATGLGSDWSNLRDMVENDWQSWRDDVLEIIYDEEDNSRRHQLMARFGDVAANIYMSKYYYPWLRRVDIVVDYRVSRAKHAQN